MKKEIQIIWSRDRTRPPLFENWNRRFPPLAKQARFLRIKTLSLQSVYEISSEWFEALQLAGAIWCSLTSASPPQTNIIDRRKTFIDLASFRLSLHEEY